MDKILIFVGLALSFVLAGFDLSKNKSELTGIQEVESREVMETLIALGKKAPNHRLPKLDPLLVKKGEELIFRGQVRKGIFKTKKISSYFVCIDCHSTDFETRNTKISSPEDRLEWGMKNDLPFLPASTFRGMYNRKSWYNGDYVKKYGDLITEAKTDLRKAIDVCAEYCSAGRSLEEWEVEAILQYLKSISLKIKDIPLNGNSKMDLENIDALTKKQRAKIAMVIEGAYTTAVPATFLPTKPVEERGMGEKGNAERGKYLYNQACMYCHEGSRVTFLHLGEDLLSANMFLKNLDNYTDESIYQIIRQGTYTMPGRNQYMPLYTKERMSDGQIEDIIAFIKTLRKE